jgi:biotin synthase-related radical SAM superfamily protein
MYKQKNMNSKKNLIKIIKIVGFITLFGFMQYGCNGKLPGADARKFPADPKLRVKQNLEEGRGFKINDMIKGRGKAGVFEFASSNELWRASLDVIDFMPLASVNYSGGIIITDWYSNERSQNESIKITIRFLTNEIRSDALNIKVFTRKCKDSLINCKYIESNKSLVAELKKEILKRATKFQLEDKEKKKKK